MHPLDSDHISRIIANGVHHATMQYLIGDVNLESERANQIDFYFGTHLDHLDYINPFINQINNFVYKSPTNSTDSASDCQFLTFVKLMPYFLVEILPFIIIFTLLTGCT